MRPGYGQPVHLLRRHGAALDQGRPGPGRGRSSSCRTGCGGGGAAAPRSLPLSPPRPPPPASSAAVAGVRACPVPAAGSPLLPALWFQPDSATGGAQSASSSPAGTSVRPLAEHCAPAGPTLPASGSPSQGTRLCPTCSTLRFPVSPAGNTQLIPGLPALLRGMQPRSSQPALHSHQAQNLQPLHMQHCPASPSGQIHRSQIKISLDSYPTPPPPLHTLCQARRT